MALIKCPECGKEISDQSKKCPFCGYPLKKADKKKILGVAGAVVGISILGVTVVYYTNNKNQVEKERQVVLEYNDYINKANDYLTITSKGDDIALEYLEDTRAVWYNSIYEEDDYSTDRYTKDDSGEFYDDFNTAISHWYLSDKAKYAESNISDSISLADEKFKELKNPPEELDTLYVKMLEVQTSFSDITDFSLNPEGSYTSFVESARNKKDSFKTAYSAAKNIVPQRKEYKGEYLQTPEKYKMELFDGIYFDMPFYRIDSVMNEKYNSQGEDVLEGIISYSNVIYGELGGDNPAKVDFIPLDSKLQYGIITVEFVKTDRLTIDNIINWVSSIHGEPKKIGDEYQWNDSGVSVSCEEKTNYKNEEIYQVSYTKQEESEESSEEIENSTVVEYQTSVEDQPSTENQALFTRELFGGITFDMSPDEIDSIMSKNYGVQKEINEKGNVQYSNVDFGDLGGFHVQVNFYAGENSSNYGIATISIAKSKKTIDYMNRWISSLHGEPEKSNDAYVWDGDNIKIFSIESGNSYITTYFDTSKMGSSED